MAEVAAHDVAPLIDHDIGGKGGDAELRQEGRLPEEAVADVGPLDAVALEEGTALGRRGVEADADDAKARTVVLLQGPELAHRRLRVVAPRCPGHDDVGIARELAVGDGVALGVDGGERRQLSLADIVGKTLELLVEAAIY